jgi:ATP-dependent Lon protease
MKGYMEDGTFSRGRDIITAEGSIVFVGNIDGDIETIVRTSNLFYPMPQEMDTAFYDRIHAYIPGWEFQKTSDAAYTSHFGLVTDYLAEVFRELRKRSYADYAERDFRFGTHLGGRDQKAVRKIVSGLIKLLHPDGDVSKEEIEEYLTYAMEMRRRVKEQLKKMGSFEYSQTSFSYSDNDTGEEHFVGVPEQGGQDLIAAEPMAPGSVYTASVTGDGTVGLYRLEVSIAAGNGKLKPAGGISGQMKESIQRAFAFLQANKSAFSISHEADSYDYNVEAIDLLGNKVEA